MHQPGKQKEPLAAPVSEALEVSSKRPEKHFTVWKAGCIEAEVKVVGSESYYQADVVHFRPTVIKVIVREAVAQSSIRWNTSTFIKLRCMVSMIVVVLHAVPSKRFKAEVVTSWYLAISSRLRRRKAPQMISSL